MRHPETKPAPELTIEDFQRYPVWEYTNDDTVDETEVQPVVDLPVRDLENMILGILVGLANGTRVWAVLCGLGNDARRNEHLLSISIFKDGETIFLSRYWDVDYERRGPEFLSRSLGLSVDEIFPITYDARKFVVGEPVALKGAISKEPRECLTEEQIIKMIVHGTAA
jgi:hypothetical protein